MSSSTLIDPAYGEQLAFAASVKDTVLQQFREYARHIIEYGEFSPDDESYDKVLHGLEIAAPQSGSTLLNSVLKWRAEALTDLGHSRVASDQVTLLRKRVLVECLFLESAIRLVSVAGTYTNILLPRQTLSELENLAFDWIMHAELYVDVRYSELHKLRDRVVLDASHLLGSLSATSLDSITERFLKELAVRIKAEASSSARQELYALCHGLRHLKLHGETAPQLRSAINFLERMFPLKHVAPDKKSRLQQSIADTLTSVLAPLADATDPGAFGFPCDPALRKQWFATVGILRTELLRWTTKQAKQATAGLPAVTVLTCLEEESALVGSIDSLVEILHKTMRDKKTASVGLMCLVRCVSCFLRRLHERSDPARLTKWVARAVGPAVHAISRGQLVAPEQLELMRQLCTVVTATLPEYGIQGMVLELLASPDSSGSQPWESSLTGLISLLSILSEVPARAAGRYPTTDLPSTAAALESFAVSSPLWSTLSSPPPPLLDQLMDIIKRGHHPLEAYGVAHLIPAVSAAVGHILRQCHQLHGYTRLTSRTFADVNSSAHTLGNSSHAPYGHGFGTARPGDRIGGLPVFTMVLNLIPLIIPEGWLKVQFQTKVANKTLPSGTPTTTDDLPGYCIHADSLTRKAAVGAFRRCLVALPPHREALIASLATFTFRLQEECTEVIRECVSLLVTMLREWDRCVTIEKSFNSFYTVSKVEGVALGLLCSHDPRVRHAALDLAREVRAVHSSWTARFSQDFAGAPGIARSRGPLSLASLRSSAPHSLQMVDTYGSAEPPPLLTLPPLHVRRSTALSGGSTGAPPSPSPSPSPSSIPSPSPLPLPSQVGKGMTHHHARRATLGSIPSFNESPVSTPAASVSASTPSAAAAWTPHSLYPHHPHHAQLNPQFAYLADIVERRGDEIAKACYWDFGPWSDTWKAWRPVPESASFESCLQAAQSSHAASTNVRWGRLLNALMGEAWTLNEACARHAHREILLKLRSPSFIVANDGKYALPQDGPRGILTRNYVMVAVAAPLIERERNEKDYEKSEKEKEKEAGEARETRWLIRTLIFAARNNVDYGVLALGCFHPSCHIIVVNELSALADEIGGGGGSGSGYSGGGTQGGGIGIGGSIHGHGHGSRGRREEARYVYSNILRALCTNLAPGSLAKIPALRDRVIEFIAETVRHIAVTGDVSPDLQQIRYCLCVVSRAAAEQLAETSTAAFPPALRKQLYDKFSLYCEEGQTPGLFRSELRRHIAAAKATSKGKDQETMRAIETELVDAAEMLEYAASLGMAAMQTGPLFDTDAGNPRGRVFSWVDRMLSSSAYHQAQAPGPGPGALPLASFSQASISTSASASTWGPSKQAVARMALRNMLRSNPELASVFVDRSYSSVPRIAALYFLVLSEVFSSLSLAIEQHVLVALILMKSVDPLPEVRDGARSMLGTLTRRFWAPAKQQQQQQQDKDKERQQIQGSKFNAEDGGAVELDGAIVLGSLPESHRAYQHHLSATLAREHAELAERLVLEVLSRHQNRQTHMAQSQSPAQHIQTNMLYEAPSASSVISCLPPWLEYASFSGIGEGRWDVAVLRALYAATAQAQALAQAQPSHAGGPGASAGGRHAAAVQELWETVASNRRNLVPTLDYVLSRGGNGGSGGPGVGTADKYERVACAVGKQIALYLSRVAPRQTIDHLAHEASLQKVEQDGVFGMQPRSKPHPMGAQGGAGTPTVVSAPKRQPTKEEHEPFTPPPPPPRSSPSNASPSAWSSGGNIKEFHHRPSLAPAQQPLPQQQPLAAHAAAAVAAAVVDVEDSSSRPFTPTSIALAIKRSTVDLIIKTGAAVADTVAVAGAAAVGISSSGGLSTPGAISRGSGSTQSSRPLSHHSNALSRPTNAAATAASPGLSGPPVFSGTPSARAVAGLDASSKLNVRPHRALLPSAPPQRVTLTRAEVALCLLSEIACERDEELRPHLSLLLHLAVLNVDSPNPLVRHEARQMLLYLLYSLAYKPLEGQATAAGPSLPPPEYARVAGMIGYLQGLPTEGNDPLWSWELPTLAEPWVPSAGYVAVFVQLVVNCFTLDGSLKERWSATALEWACCAASRHAASRSHQVYCALSPRLSSTACTALLAALHKCLASATPEGLDTAVEVLCTLRVLLTNTPPTKLVLYPHLFVACIALLCSSVVRIGELATAMLIQLLDALDLSAPPHVAGHAILSVISVPTRKTDHEDVESLSRNNNRQRIPQNVWVLGDRLLSGAPDVDDDRGAGGPWFALQQLLIKGLFQPDTLPLALRGMGAIARQVSRAGTIVSGKANLSVARQVHAVFGAAEVGLVLSIAAALPWLYVHCVHCDLDYAMNVDHDDSTGLALAGFLEDTAAACLAVGWDALAAACAVLSSKMVPSIELKTPDWLQEFVEMLAEVTFPVYTRLTVQRLVEVVERGEEKYQYAALKILATLFRAPGICLGSLSWFTNGSRLLDVISAAVSLEGPLGGQGLDVLAAMASHRTVATAAGGDGGKDEEFEEPLEWARCMDDMGESNKVCAEALRRVVESSPGSAELIKAVGGVGTPNERHVYGGASTSQGENSSGSNANDAITNASANLNLNMNLNVSGGVPASDALLPFLPSPVLR